MNSARAGFLGLAVAGLVLGLTSCGQRKDAHSSGDADDQLPVPREPAVARPKASGEVSGEVVEWEALMPQDDLGNRPPPNFSFGKGIGGSMTPGSVSIIDHSGTQRAEQWGSSKTVPELNGRAVALDGYVVPLEFDDQGRMTDFFFVPFYGACIHVPPPPPNQTLFGHLSQPMDTPELIDAYHLEGTLRTKQFDADIARAAYTIAEPKLALLRP